MKALISGQMGLAALVSDEDIAFLSIDRLRELIEPCATLDHALSGASDIKLLENATVEIVREEVLIAWSRDRCLHLMLLLIDPKTQSIVRTAAARHASLLMKESQVMTFIRNRFYAAPMPEQADLSEAIACVQAEGSGVVEDLLVRIVGKQDDIRRCRAAWDEISADAPALDEIKPQVFNKLVEMGAFFELSSCRAGYVNAAVREYSSKAELLMFPHSRYFISLWGKNIEAALRTETPKEQVRPFPASRFEPRDSHVALISVAIVTYNNGRFIRRCLEAVLEQHYPHLEVIVIDNASTDGTMDILGQFEDRCRIHYNQENIGFAAAQNQAIGMSQSQWVLALNPDVLLMPGFIAELVIAGNLDPEVGTVCGKLLSINAAFDLPEEQLVDSTGIYFTPMLRHLDRGSQEPDKGHYLNFEYVFGATAAAALYRRQMIEDISIHGEFFDADFFVYREDADVAWRAQLMGWRCLYTPRACGYHVRSVLPGKRQALPPEINMHSVKNRFLMRIKNMTPDLYRRNWMAITGRDLVVIAACLLHEHSSLKAFGFVLRNLKRVMAKRREIMRRRRVTDDDLASWFSFQPVGRAARQSEASAGSQVGEEPSKSVLVFHPSDKHDWPARSGA
jgi:GT2 family glycosyltransferase